MPEQALRPRAHSPGEPPAPESGGKVLVRLCLPGEERCENLPPERISDLLPQEGSLIWVEIRDPGPDEIKMLREEFNFHSLALEDAGKQLQRPKVDEYPGYYFVVLYAPVSLEGDQVRMVEVDLFVGRNYVVSLHRGELPAIQEALSRWERTDAELRKDVGFLLHTIVDSLIDAYFPVVDGIEDRLDRLELSMFEGRVAVNAEELLGVKRSLFALRKAVYPMREVFNTFLRRDGSLFSADTYPYFQDVYDHVLRLLDIVDIQRDMATGVLDAHLAIISNRLNETMKTLTLLAICVAIAGAAFGAWGMNFTHVPLDYLGIAGFYRICAATLGVIVLALWWAKRRGL